MHLFSRVVVGADPYSPWLRRLKIFKHLHDASNLKNPISYHIKYHIKSYHKKIKQRKEHHGTQQNAGRKQSS